MTSLLIASLERLHSAQSKYSTATADAHVIHGDSLAIMDRLPTQSIHMVSADPPYFLSNGGSTNSGGSRAAVGKGSWDESDGARRDHEFHRTWLRSVQRLLKPEGSLLVSGTHHNIFSIGWAMQLMGWRIINTITWEKPNPPPNLGTRCLTHSTETILWASPNRDTPQRHVFNYDEAKANNEGRQLKDVWRFTAPSAAEKTNGKHPAQKPIELLNRIIELSTHRGDIVLDPFCGSGTTLVSAIALGRTSIGMEQDERYYELTCSRLSQAVIDQQKSRVQSL